MQKVHLMNVSTFDTDNWNILIEARQFLSVTLCPAKKSISIPCFDNQGKRQAVLLAVAKSTNQDNLTTNISNVRGLHTIIIC